MVVGGNLCELPVLSVNCGECSTHAEGDRECSTYVKIIDSSLVCCRECLTPVVVVIGPVFCCGEFSTLLLLSSNFADLSIRLYSVLVLIFSMA